MWTKRHAVAIVALFVGCVPPSPANTTNDVSRRPPVTLLEAVSANNTNRVRELLAQGSDPNIRIDSSSETAIFRAALWGHAEVTKMLMEAGADPLAKDKWENTPFHFAVAHGHRNVAELLLAKGAQFDGRNLVGETPLLQASREGCEETALWVLELGADPNAQATNSPARPIFYAALRGKTAAVQSLLKRGARTDVKGQLGWSPLHAAVVRGDTNVVGLLIKSGCTLDPTDDRGFTPLLLGIHQGQGNQAAIVDHLVTAGADIKKMDKNGNTALDLAQRRVEKVAKGEMGTKESRDASVGNAKALLGRIKYHCEQRLRR